MALYKLSTAAALDFEHIFEFGIDAFGLDRALVYQDSLKQRFQEIAIKPNQFPRVDHLYKGYRRSIHGSHAIYFQDDPTGVLIVRILGQQNLAKAF